MRCPMLWPKFDSMLAVPESWPRSAMRIQKKWPAFGVPVAGHFTGSAWQSFARPELMG